MTLASPDLDTDLATWAQEDVPLPCEHSQHATHREAHDDGPATHWFQSNHECPEDSRGGTLYAGCAKWHAFVVDMLDKRWMCRRCMDVMPGRDMVTVVGPVSLA